MGNFRWTVVFENEDGKWLIVHEHVSAPLPVQERWLTELQIVTAFDRPD